MIICKELFKDGMLENGYCPVVIRIFHNGKSEIVGTSIFTKERYWDIAGCRLNSHERDHKVKNEIIESVYRRVSGQIQNIIDSILDDKFEEIINPIKDDEDISLPESRSMRHKPRASYPENHELFFIDLIDRKVESSVSHNTRRGYEGFRRYIEKRFGDGPSLSDITQDFTNKFIESIDSDYRGSESMRRLMISRYNAVLNFGKDAGLIPRLIKIALPPYYLLPADRNLSGEEICNIFSAFNEAVADDPDIRKRETEALGLFILDIAFQGLAPVDLANLKVKSINFTTVHAFDKNPRRYVDDEEYRKLYDAPDNRIRTVTLSTTRKKTGRPVQIIASTLGIERFIHHMIAAKDAEDYLLPCFDPAFNYSPSQRQNRLANYFNMMARNLNRGISKYYRRHNLGENRRVTFYFARHAFCNLVDSLDVPRHIIQNMVGHRSSVLETSYLRPISQWEQAKISHTLLSRYFAE